MTLSRTQVARETARRMRRAELETGEQVRRLRLDAGVSLSDVARIAGVHRSHIARVEAARAHASLEVLTAIGVALGAEVSIRFFSGSGPRLHDRSQAAMVEAFLQSIDARWRIELEVPITQPSRGVIDIVLTDRVGGVTIAAEAQSQLRRLDEQIRWAAEKAEGLAQRIVRQGATPEARSVSRLLILRSTVSTREIARRYRATLAAAYPARTEDIARALTSPVAR